MEFFDFFRDYPALGGSAIAIIGASIGAMGNYIFQLINEKIKYKRELKLYLLREKINAAKKASEYYLEQLNYYNLLQHQLEFLSSTENPSPEMIDSLDKAVAEFTDKLKRFPHYEHHHINIFYEVEDERSIELVSESLKLNQEILGLRVTDDDELEIIEEKLTKLTQKADRQKEIYQEHYRILKEYLNSIRDDIRIN